ncbi:uncharacterized protein CIMG_12999 [Coccidioides immitis RS]|uniref:Uncharacterized protein n=1 Tax=Coccidioides immitis (strain RS) TaxID=246410 RepID=A0A0D8JT02_COCIM|nr:uncharacterized protein CIMG_12999 [Coccidioides immitis RS]KJF60480.1 hypothetical protein CIMG_12999 [Coccidioides immitis RS]
MAPITTRGDSKSNKQDNEEAEQARKREGKEMTSVRGQGRRLSGVDRERQKRGIERSIGRMARRKGVKGGRMMAGVLSFHPDDVRELNDTFEAMPPTPEKREESEAAAKRQAEEV